MIAEQIVPIRKLDRSRDHVVDFVPNNSQIDEILRHTDWRQLKNIRLKGKLFAIDEGWNLNALLSGTVTLNCVISGAPIHYRLNTIVNRKYLTNGAELPEEMSWDLDFDVDSEELPQNLDLLPLILETIALEVPDYPKLAKFESTSDTSPWQLTQGEASDQETQRPFANLQALLDNKNER